MNRKWSELDMRRAAAYWFVKPSSRYVAGKTNIPQQTVNYWARKSDEFRGYVEDIRAKHQSRLDSRITSAIDSLMDQLEDRIENGDYKYDAKLMDNVRVPMTGKDLVQVFKEVYDRRAMLRGEPTSRSDSTGKASTRSIEKLLTEKMSHMSLPSRQKGYEHNKDNLPDHMKSKKPQVPAELKKQVH